MLLLLCKREINEPSPIAIAKLGQTLFVLLEGHLTQGFQEQGAVHVLEGHFLLALVAPIAHPLVQSKCFDLGHFAESSGLVLSAAQALPSLRRRQLGALLRAACLRK